MMMVTVKFARKFQTESGEMVGPMVLTWGGAGQKFSNGDSIEDPRVWATDGTCSHNGHAIIAEVIGENVRVIPINEAPDEGFERMAEARGRPYDDPPAYSEIIEKVNIAEAAFNSMIGQAEEDGRKVFTSEMERAIKSAEISPNEYDRAPNHVESTTRARILNTAKEYVTKDRQATHGKPEDTFGLIAAYWSAHLDTNVTSTDVAAMMGLLKLARAKQNPGNHDNWIDLAGYAACAGELAG